MDILSLFPNFAPPYLIVLLPPLQGYPKMVMQS